MEPAIYRAAHGLAPGSFAVGFGAFSPVPDQVLVGGVAGQIIAANQSQVNFVLPAKASVGNTVVSVRAAGKELANGEAIITGAGPGIFVRQPTDPS